MRLSTLSLGILALAALAACTPAPSTSIDMYNSSSSASWSSFSSVDAGSLSHVDTSSSPTTVAPGSNAMWDGKILTGKHVVTLKTSKGTITLELDADSSPKTVTNFVTLAQKGFYNGLTFHRVIPGFMIQGGDPKGNGTGGSSIYGPEFADEISNAPALYKTGYKAGVVAMANSGPDTNGSQFFIMEADYPLPPDYTIFGKVTAGQDVVSAIAKVPRDNNDMPKTPVTFTPTVVK